MPCARHARSSLDVTSSIISDTIDRDYSGDVLAFLAEFIDYCNAYTIFGTPAKYAPLDEVRHEFDTVLCTTCEELIEASDGVEPAIVELEQEYDTEFYSVYATRYYRDSDTDNLVSEDWAPHFIVTRPEELARLSEYIGVNFDSEFFEE